MEDALSNLKNWQVFHSLMISMCKYPILGILTGAVITGIIQSSSVTTSVVVALAGKDVIPLPSAIPLILGANIGTCVTALIASINTRLSARRTAIAHLFFNIIGVILIFPFLSLFTRLVSLTSSDTARQVANAHTIFNVLWAFIWIWFTKEYARIIKRIVPGEERIVIRKPLFLNPLLLNTPSTALESARKELIRMTEISEEMFNLTFDCLENNHLNHYDDIKVMEELTDSLKANLINYLTKLSAVSLSEGEAKELNAILRSVDDVERIADHLTNIMEKTEDMISSKVEFSDFAKKDLDELKNLVFKNMKNAFEMIRESHVSRLKEVESIEKEINNVVKEAINKHIERMKIGVCNPIAGLIFSDILTNLERIGDHSINIAQNFEEINLIKKEILV
ncbi:MAG: Na/Pi symporter [Dictyoglomaceae bacterium]|nr:Na/Pi symporter [Dictyoglomaceae bacterium]